MARLLRLGLRMKPILKRLWREENGEDLVEYGLLVAFAAAVVTAAVLDDRVGLKSALSDAFNKVRDALEFN
jgi:Flp pilus assembly pilin Flp